MVAIPSFVHVSHWIRLWHKEPLVKNLSVREIREALPKLEKLLAKHGELVITRRGRSIARLTPLQGKTEWPSLAKFRASMPFQEIPSEDLIREDRDSR